LTTYFDSFDVVLVNFGNCLIRLLGVKIF
jgi:hypothetical protein